MDLMDYLKMMVERDASDLFLTTGAPPTLKIQGDYLAVQDKLFTQGEVKEIAYKIMKEEKWREFERLHEMNLALSVSGVGRFRVNVFLQRDEVAVVIRAIKMKIPFPDELRMPDVLKSIVMKKSGLVLFVGATGTGKSTSLASLIQYRSKRLRGHIITVEDPIEFLHHHAKAMINQREIGVDTDSYANALVNAMRQAPDVILVGEVRDRSTMEHVMTFAETGHLCLTTLHAYNASQAIERLINFFPEDRHRQLLLDLSMNLAAIVSQRLVKMRDGDRCAAFEILLASPLICDLIKRGQIDTLREVMQKSETTGMQLFDTALFRLYEEGRITEEEALLNSDSPNNLRLRIKLSRGGGGNSGELSLKDEVAKSPMLRRPKNEA